MNKEQYGGELKNGWTDQYQRLMKEIADLKKMLATAEAERDFYRAAWERDRG